MTSIIADTYSRLSTEVSAKSIDDHMRSEGRYTPWMAIEHQAILLNLQALDPAVTRSLHFKNALEYAFPRLKELKTLPFNTPPVLGCAGKTVKSLENACHTWAP